MANSIVMLLRDVNETLAYETETRPRHSFLVGDETETKTFLQFHESETCDFCHETRPRPCKAETETL